MDAMTRFREAVRRNPATPDPMAAQPMPQAGPRRQFTPEEERFRAALRRNPAKPTPLVEMSPDMIEGADVSNIRLSDIEAMTPAQQQAAQERAHSQGLAPERPSDSTALGVTQAAAQPLTAGFGDELTGRLSGAAAYAQASVTGSMDPRTAYHLARTHGQQEARQSMSNLSPMTRIGAEVAGSVPAMLLPFGRAAEAGGIAAKTGRSVGYGAAGGTVAGFGSGEGGFENRLVSAGIGLVTGGTIGAAGYGTAELLKKGIQKVAKGKRGSLTKAEKRAYEGLLDAFRKDGVSLDEAKSRLYQWHQSGTPAMLLDLGGEHVRGLAEYAAARPNAYEIARSALRDRAAGAQGRIDAKLTELLGNGAEFAGTARALRDMRSEAASELYNQAFAARIDPSKGNLIGELQGLLNRPSGKQAQRRAAQIAAERGEDFAHLPLMQRLHYYKLGLDDVAYSAKRSTQESGAGAVQRGAQEDTARQFRDILIEISPEYAEAVRRFAGDSEVIDALQSGMEVFSTRGGQMAEDVAAYVGNLSEAGREAYRLGVARQIKLRMETAKNGADGLRRWFNSAEWRERMRPAFETEEAFADFTGAMFHEAQVRSSMNQVLGNSATARRQAGQAVFGAQGTPVRDFVEKAANRDYGSIIREGYHRIGNRVAENRADETATAAMQALTGPIDPHVLQAMWATYFNKQNKGVSRAGAATAGGASARAMESLLFD